MKIYSVDRKTIIKDPYDLSVVKGLTHGNSFEYSPSRHEYFVVQLLLHSEYDVAEVDVETGALQGADGKKFERAVTCFNTEGVGADGKKFTRKTYLNAGEIKPLFIGIDFSRAGIGGYSTQVKIGEETVKLKFELTDALVFNEGIDEETTLARLKWLNSTEYLDKRLVDGYDAISADKNSVRFTGKRAIFTGDGLIGDVESSFTESNALSDEVTANLFFRPMEFIAEGQKFKYNRLRIADKPYSASVTSDGRSEKLHISVVAEARYEGSLRYVVNVTADTDAIVPDIRLNAYFASAKYIMGLGKMAGKLTDVDYKWDINGADSIYVGNVNCGARVRFCAERDAVTMPVYGDYARTAPIVPQDTWANYGKGGITLTAVEEGAVLTAYTGKMIFTAGESKDFVFEVLLTPFRPIDLGASLGNRVGYLKGDNVQAYLGSRQAVAIDGITAGYGSPLNKNDNNPLSDVKGLKKLALVAHKHDLSCGVSYSINTYKGDWNEYFALRSFDGEIILDGCEERFVRPHSRFDNLFVESAKHLVENADIDYVSMQDPSITATTAERINKCMTRKRGGGFWELVLSDRIAPTDGALESLNLYADVIPFASRLAVKGYGKEIDDDRALIAMSGIAFGITADSEVEFGVCRGLLYGMLPRIAEEEQAEALADIRKLLRELDISHAEFKGYWDKKNPVSADNARVRCSSYVNGKNMLMVVYNDSDEKTTFEIGVENKLGYTTVGKKVRCPGIMNMQKERKFNIGKPVKLKPRSGIIVTVVAPEGKQK